MRTCGFHTDRLSDDWNSHERFAALETSLMSLCLPQFEFGGEGMEEWEDACEEVRQFVAAVGDKGNDTALLSRWVIPVGKIAS